MASIHLRPLNLRPWRMPSRCTNRPSPRNLEQIYAAPRGCRTPNISLRVSISAVEGGDGQSAEAVRHKIRLLISNEKPGAVLSDDDIVDTLKKGGIELARRTVAKIPGSHEHPVVRAATPEKRALAKVASF